MQALCPFRLVWNSHVNSSQPLGTSCTIRNMYIWVDVWDKVDDEYMFTNYMCISLLHSLRW
jgi:hypothetical protein